MRINSLSRALLIWMLLATIAFSVSKRFHKMLRHEGPDITAADEEHARYPALDLEDTCKKAKNPKCEAIIDRFCIKSCTPYLCGEHGSIRGMCRLMCEVEDLPPQCIKMAPTKIEPTHNNNTSRELYGSQQVYPFGYGMLQ